MGRQRKSPGATVDALVGRHRLAADAVLAALIAIPLGIVSVSLLRASDSPLPLRLTAGVLVLIIHVCTVFRRERPGTAYGVAAAAMAALVVMPPLHDPAGTHWTAVALPSSAAFGLLLFTVAGQVGRLGSLAALGVAAVGVAMVVARSWDPASWGGSSGTYQLVVWRVGLAVGLAAAALSLWSLGRLGRTRMLYLAELRTAAERAERDRISRELHDVVSHSLAVMVSQAEGGRLSAPDSAGASVFGTIARVGREALRDMRGLVGVLRSDDPPSTAPQPGLGDLPELLDQVRATRVRLEVHETGTPRPLRPAVDLTAYRVVQEALTNVIKHAGASPAATLSLAWTEEALTVEVHDDGPARQSHHSPGVGLTGMRERLDTVGGRLELSGPTNTGFRLTAEIPYQGRNLPSSGS